jgi:hypothetical protein
MSDSTPAHNSPPPKGPALHAHDATSKTEDVKPKVITTAHKNLSKDEFQRKVAMLARVKAAELEKEALGPLAAPLIIGGATLASAIPGFYWMAGGQGGNATPAANYRGGALGGAGVGAGLGALHGLVAPGEETEYDEAGNVIGKKRRSRLAAMLRGGLAGAGMGAAGGAAAEHLRPGTADSAYNAASQFGNDMAKKLSPSKAFPYAYGGGTGGVASAGAGATARK